MSIDTSKIENYASMTHEEKVAALEAYVPDMSGYVDKKQFDKAASEIANYKKQLSERMTAEEVEKAAREEEFSGMKNELETLRKESNISKYTAKYIGLGYDEALAKSTAEAYCDGNMDAVLENHKKYNDSIETKVKTKLMDDYPKPAGGSADASPKDTNTTMNNFIRGKGEN